MFKSPFQVNRKRSQVSTKTNAHMHPSRTDFDVVIVGAGHAGVNLAANLTKGGYRGTIALLGEESTLPYKRPPLSKGFLLGSETQESLPLRSADYWTNSQVELVVGSEVVQVLPDERTVVTRTGAPIRYGHLVWATGGRARTLPTTGANTAGVHTVRTIYDVIALKQELSSARRAVIIGGGFIGLETAAAFRGIGIEVTVVEAAQRVLERVTSPPVSEHFQRVHRSAGVDLRLGVGVVAFHGRERVTAVELTDASLLPADLVVVGVGLQPNTEVLQAAGVSCNSQGVEVDEFCRTNLPHLSAAGDCTSQDVGSGRRVRIESVQNANEQSKVVASDLLGSPVATQEVPWFWSDQYDVKLKTAGLIGNHDDMVVRGNVSAGEFTVCYLSDGALIAVDCVNTPKDFAQARALLRQRTYLDREALTDPSRPLREFTSTV